MIISNTQIDRLGDRLRKGPLTDSDLTILDEYRKSFSRAFEEVIQIIQIKFKLEVSGRPEKTTSSIVDKIKRERTRLSRMQDIAGCRIIVSGIEKQEYVLFLIKQEFSKLRIIDRRVKSSHGYRAVHAVIDIGGKLIEIQVRTQLQDGWAQLSEKFADKVDNNIKYGKGPQAIQKLLAVYSKNIESLEIAETEFMNIADKCIDKNKVKNVSRMISVLKKKLLDELGLDINVFFRER